MKRSGERPETGTRKLKVKPTREGEETALRRFGPEFGKRLSIKDAKQNKRDWEVGGALNKETPQRRLYLRMPCMRGGLAGALLKRGSNRMTHIGLKTMGELSILFTTVESTMAKRDMSVLFKADPRYLQIGKQPGKKAGKLSVKERRRLLNFLSLTGTIYRHLHA